MKTAIFLCVISIACLLSAGCSSYAPPDLSLTPHIRQVNASAQSLSITYDVSADVENKGENNAYDVEIMIIVSTPKDLPEYRFVHEIIPIGTIEKHSKTEVQKEFTLVVTDALFQKLVSGECQPIIRR